jgi:hypothetical protein
MPGKSEDRGVQCSHCMKCIIKGTGKSKHARIPPLHTPIKNDHCLHTSPYKSVRTSSHSHSCRPPQKGPWVVVSHSLSYPRQPNVFALPSSCALPFRLASVLFTGLSSQRCPL